MKLYANQLAGHLKKQLSPLYLLSGDEPLLMQESADLIRDSAKKADFTERDLLSVGTGFDWAALQHTAQNRSLFATKRLVELRLNSEKIGAIGSKALSLYAKNPAPDITLLIIAPKLSASTQKAAWVKAIDKTGCFIQVWPIEREQLPAWINARLHAVGIPPSKELVDLLVNRAEGNLLAAKQEIDKLSLLATDKTFSVEDAARAIMQSSRYTIFDFVSAYLCGDTRRTLKIIKCLRADNTDMILIIWALSKELRIIAHIMQAKAHRPLPELFREHGVWRERQKTLGHYLARHSLDQVLSTLQLTAKLDKIAKGYIIGSPWELLEQNLC